MKMKNHISDRVLTQISDKTLDNINEEVFDLLPHYWFQIQTYEEQFGNFDNILHLIDSFVWQHRF